MESGVVVSSGVNHNVTLPVPTSDKNHRNGTHLSQNCTRPVLGRSESQAIASTSDLGASAAEDNQGDFLFICKRLFINW